MMLYIYYNIIYIPTISHHPSLLLSAICRSKVGHGENMLASDASAIVEHTKAGATSRGHQQGPPGATWGHLNMGHRHHDFFEPKSTAWEHQFSENAIDYRYWLWYRYAIYRY